MSRRQDPDTIEAIKRAGARAAYHLLRAGVESLKAVEAILDELGRARHEDGDGDGTIRERIDIE